MARETQAALVTMRTAAREAVDQAQAALDQHEQNCRATWVLATYPEVATRLAEAEGSMADVEANRNGAESGSEEAAANGWRQEVGAFLNRDNECSEAEWEAQARTILDMAIARGELPVPATRSEGTELSRGVLTDWLAPGQPYVPYGPDYHVPVVELLGGGLHARWDIWPDGETAPVRARREQIAETLFHLALLDGEEWPSIHPPTSRAARDAAADVVLAKWPWGKQIEELRDRVRAIGAQHAQWQAALTQHIRVLEEIQDEDFAGEDPLSPELRETLEQTKLAHRTVEKLWELAGEAFRTDPEDWPALPTVSEKEEAASLRQYRLIFRDRPEAAYATACYAWSNVYACVMCWGGAGAEWAQLLPGSTVWWAMPSRWTAWEN